MRILWPVPQPERFRIDVGFLDPSYPRWRQQNRLPPAEHPGIDLNLGAGDFDLGWPVVAIAEGRVVHAGFHRVWGNIVLLEHDLPGLGRFWSQYAHLLHLCVAEGQWVWPGEPVGAIGKGDPKSPFLAHLHFELRKTSFPADHWPGMDRAYIQENYLNPLDWLRTNHRPIRRLIRSAVIINGQRRGEAVINLERPDLAWINTGQ